MFKPPVYEDLTHEELTEKFDALMEYILGTDESWCGA